MQEEKNDLLENDSSFKSKESLIRFDGDSDQDDLQKEEIEEDYLICGEDNFISIVEEENLIESVKKKLVMKKQINEKSPNQKR